MRRINGLMASMLVAVPTMAADIYMTAADVNGPTTSFNGAGKWSNGLPPDPANTYRTAYQMRTPDNTTGTAYTFAAPQLTINAGGSLLLKSSGALTITNLVLNGGSIGHGLDNYTGKFFGGITVNSASSITANENNPRSFMFFSTISGAGNLTIGMAQTNSLKQTSFLADNSGYTGKLTLRGKGKFGVCAEEGMGGNPAALATNQVTFEGMTLIATNSFTINDPNRGFTLGNTLNAGSQIYPGGVFEVTGTNALTVGCPIGGAGPLTKRGTGLLALTATNTYTGVTTVEAGLLSMAAGASNGRPSAVVTGVTAAISGEGTLSNLTLVAGGRLGAAKGGWELNDLTVQNTTNVTFEIDLSEAQTNVTLIRVGGALSKQTLQVFHFVFNTNNALESPYQILSASNLSAFADYEFCVTPPWIGELSRAPDAGGGQVVLFNPTPPEKRSFLVVSDPINTTAFVEASRWSDGLAPTNQPTGVKTHVSTNNSLRTPYNKSLTFGGKRLIMDGQNIALKGSPYPPTIHNLTMMNDASFSMAEAPRGNMAGNILIRPVLVPGRTYGMRASGQNAGRDLNLYSTLAGIGDLFLQNMGNPNWSSNRYTLFAMNTNFFGKIHVDGHTNFWVRIGGEDRLGGNPLLFSANQLQFNGGGLSVTNDVTLDDANRGITLLAAGGTSPTDDNEGGFPTGTPSSARLYPGGCVLRPEGTSTLAVDCPVTGAGSLTKSGAGTLVLGGENTYTGLTQVTDGTLVPASTNAFGTGPVAVRAGGSLQIRHPDAAMPYGVSLGAAITFDAGAQVKIAFDPGFSPSGLNTFSVPLFLLPAGETIDPATVPVVTEVQYFRPTVVTDVLGEGVAARVLVSVKYQFRGTLLMLQ